MTKKDLPIITALLLISPISLCQSELNNNAATINSKVPTSSIKTVTAPTNIQFRIALENLDIKSYNYSKKSTETDLKKMSGLNIALAYEFKIINELSTSTVASVSYAKHSNESL